MSLRPNSNNFETFKIILVGPYPEPYGGVSIHVKRLKENLVKKYFKKRIFKKRSKKAANMT